MSSYKKSAKSVKRTHRERGQLSSRKHLGLLEKHKDYVLRARDYGRKKQHLKALHEKARNKNPDEFYYRMVNEKLQDGRHVIPQNEEKLTSDQMKVMKTQDIKYVEMKHRIETKKVEQLRAGLHLIGQKPTNSHTIFVDSQDEATELRSEVVNDPPPKSDPHSHTPTEHKKAVRVPEKELERRIRRCKDLARIAQKMRTQKDLIAKGKKTRIPGNDNRPPTYVWRKERKR